MIARHENVDDARDIWAKLAAPIPTSEIEWRQDGKPILRDGKYFARFVAYINAQFVRQRLDLVCPGEWDLTLELLPPPAASAEEEAEVTFKARLQILGVIRESIGTGRDYKTADSDAFKRAAVRFGIGHELYDYEQNWVQVDGDGKYPKPVEDPNEAYARRQARNAARRPARTADASAPAWANDGDVKLTDEGEWIVKGIPLADMDEKALKVVLVVAEKRGYQDLVKACKRIMTERALAPSVQ